MPQLACEPFTTVEDVLASSCACSLTEVDDGVLIEELIDDASDFLYIASGGRIAGVCERTVWPISDRACGVRSIVERWSEHYSSPFVVEDAIPLRGPNLEIVSVVIDGVTLGPSEYGVYDGSFLFRREGSWPTGNDIRKTAGEAGTFTVRFRFGEPITRIAMFAANELVCQMMRDPSALSRLNGVVAATVQGVSVTTDAADELGSLGIPAVTRFLDRYAPLGIAWSGVWSPDFDNGWTLVSVS